VIDPRLLLAALLLSAVAAQAGNNKQSSGQAVTDIKVDCVPASQAFDMIGQHGCVAGRVFRVTTGKNGNQHLTLCPPHSDCSFHVAVARRDLEKVGDLSYLRGKYVAFDGNIVNFRGRPRIVVRDREQIHVTAGSPGSEFDSQRARPKGAGGGKTSRAW